jgi:hypothetical protein
LKGVTNFPLRTYEIWPLRKLKLQPLGIGAFSVRDLLVTMHEQITKQIEGLRLVVQDWKGMISYLDFELKNYQLSFVQSVGIVSN